MAPVWHIGAGDLETATSDSANALTANKPANTADDDLLVAYVCFRNSGATITPPSGFEELGFSDFNATWGIYGKPITDAASEPASYEFTTAGAGSSRCTLAIFRVTGANLTTPKDAEGADSGNNNQTSVEAPSVAADSTNCLLLMAIHGHKADSTAPGVTPDPAMTELVELSAGTSATTTTQLSGEALVSSGATGTRTATYDPVADNGVAFLVTIKPEPQTVAVGQAIETDTPIRITDGSVDPITQTPARVSLLGDGATSGATVTTANSGRKAGVPILMTSVGTDATLTWDDTQAFHGANALKVVTGASAVNCWARWDRMFRPVAGNKIVASVWLYFTAHPSASTSIVHFTNSSVEKICELRVATDGTVRVFDATTTQQIATTNAISTNQWVRVDLFVTPDAADGTLQVVLYNDATNSTPTETTSEATGLNLRQDQVEVSFMGVTNGATDVTYWMHVYLADDAAGAAPFGTGWVQSRWVGGVTEDAATFAAKVLAASTSRLVVSQHADLSNPIFSASEVPDADGTCRYTVTGLIQDLDYYYGIEVDGTVDEAMNGRFRTLPTEGQPASFGFAAASCARSHTNADTFSEIVARTGADGRLALFFTHLGDLHYEDIGTNNQVEYHRAYDQVMAAPKQSTLFGNLNTPYVWSDHDFGGQNVDGTIASEPAAQAVYRSRVADPGLEVADATYFSFVVGRIRMIFTDGRTFMDPIDDPDDENKTKLGATQKAWLKSELTAAEPVKLWFHEDAISNGATFVGDDTWSAYATERTELADYIVANNVAVAYISGDLHCLAADDGTNVEGNFPVFVCSPLDNSAYLGNGTYTAGTYPTSNSSPPNYFELYGWFDVTDADGQISISFTGYDSGGTSRITLTHNFNVIVGQATETDTAQPITGRKIFHLGQAAESDSGQTFLIGPTNVFLGQAVETDSAQAIGFAKAKRIGRARETNAAFSITSPEVQTTWELHVDWDGHADRPEGLLLTGESGGYASTPDDASLDITTDIDLRAWIIPDDYDVTPNQALVAKYVPTGDQRSYALFLDGPSGHLQIRWFPDGTVGTGKTVNSTEPVPHRRGGIAVRAGMETSNGDVQFWTADSIDGPWSVLGEFVTGSGPTSIHAGTAPLEVGSFNNGTGNLFTGTIKAAEVWDGIEDVTVGAVRVANPDFTGRTNGTTSIVDDHGLTWTVNGDAHVTGTGAFDDAEDDVSARLRREGIAISYGRDQARSLAPIAPGEVDFELDNQDRHLSPDNTASPISGTVLPARPVRFRADYGGKKIVLYRGHLDDFDVLPDRDNRSVKLSCLDVLANLKETKVSTELFQGVRTGEAIGHLLDAIGWPTEKRDLDLGATHIRWWWVEDEDAWEALEQLVNSEGPPAYCFADVNGNFTFKDRHHRITDANALTLQQTFRDIGDEPLFSAPLVYDLGWRDVVNHVAIDVDERDPLAKRETVWENDQIINLSANQTTVIQAVTDDPFFDVADLIYTLRSGSVSVLVSPSSAQSAEITITAGSGGASVSDLQLSAYSVEVRRTIKVIKEDVASQKRGYGLRSLPYEAPWAGVHDAAAIGDLILAYRAERLPVVSMRVVNGTQPRRVEQLNRDLSDRVHVIEAETAQDHDFFIERIEHTVSEAGKFHETTFGLERVVEPMNPDTALRFDVAGQGFDDGLFVF